MVLGRSNTLLGGPAEPLHRLCVVFRYAQAFVIHIHARRSFLHLEREYELDQDITWLLLKHLKRLTASRPKGDLVQFDTLAKSFSDTYSEHIEWKSENLLPLLRDRLTKMDFTDLEHTLLPQNPNRA